jgi:para-nitrobenzyl esterase
MKLHINRRDFIRQSSLLGMTALVMPWRTFGLANTFPVADTIYGKVRGMDVAGIKTFRGVRYGESTADSNRFMPPVKPKKWNGVVDALGYGPASPQKPGDPTNDYTQAVNWDAHVKIGVSEDCLVLNIWTPGLKDGGNRPVMFYIHGGGFTSGSGGFPFDGDPMARLGDVVVITVNHRLGPFGYLDLDQAGWPSKYKYAGVAGMMDLVAALEWVRDNITNFGGNPNNVMIYGQSGGGAKTSILMAMPSARGLFHRAAIQSGSALKAGTKVDGKVSASKLVKELGIGSSKADDIQKIHWSHIIDAEANNNFHPSVDGEIIPHHPFDPKAPEESASVPLVVGYTLEDAAFFGGGEKVTDQETLKSWVHGNYKENAESILKAYPRVYPNASPIQLRSRIATDAWIRMRATRMAERKSAQGGAPVYMYLLEWPSPSFEGKFGAVHGVDLGLVLADPRIPIEGNTPAARKMANIVGSSFAAFAKTGDPNCTQLPSWPRYDSQTRSVMIFNQECRVDNDPTQELRLLWEKFDA